MSNGAVLWEGISQLDKTTPIAVILVGLKTKSKNTKTGGMIQSYILRTDIHPLDALKQKADNPICGDCKHNYSTGNRSCYVNVGQGPSRVYETYQKGNYMREVPLNLIAGRPVRFGTYGDPAAVPYEVWEKVLDELRKDSRPIWTGYTHAWKYCDPRFKNFCMASVDTQEEYEQARTDGWRTFRVMHTDEEIIDKEFLCPASDEAYENQIRKAAKIGKLEVKKLTCEECGACNGGSKKSTVAIYVHGTHWKKKAFLTLNGAEINVRHSNEAVGQLT